MARLLTIAAVLLRFVQADNISCSQMPYAALANYEPARQWCASLNHPANPSVQCGSGDFLCAAFANLDADAARFLW